MSRPAAVPETPRPTWAWHALLLAVLSGWLAGVRLPEGSLYDPDEPRTALVARLMAERGDWLAPHLPAVFHHDYPHDPVEGDLLAYWDKPPLYFWLAAGAMKALGPTALAARLPAALSLVAAVLMAYAAGRSLWGARAGFLAGVVMAVSPMPLAMAHAARMDALLAALMTAMLLAMLRLMLGLGRAWVWTLVLYVAAGLGILTKGLEAVVFPAAAVAVATALTGRWRDLRRLRPLQGALVCLAVAAPWFVYMHFRYPGAADGQGTGFLYEFFVRQHFGRAGGETGQKLPPGSLAAILLAGLMPWTIFLPAACARLGRKGWRERRENPAVLLLIVWPLLIVGVFSFLKTAMLHYVLPAFPPLAILLGAYLDERLSDGVPDRWFRRGMATAVVLGGVAVAGAIVYLVRNDLWRPEFLWTFAAAAAVTLAGLASVLRDRRQTAVGLLLAWMVIIATFFLTSDPLKVYATNSTQAEARTIIEALRPGDEVLAYPYTPYSLTWYFWPHGVRYPAPAGDPDAASFTDLVRELNHPHRTFCVLQKHSVLEQIQGRVQWPVQVLSTMPGHTLFVTTPPESAGAALPQPR
ncbi:MAG: glycosyltransferase family 39 protein [Planctomycetota bacterium]|nr:glycosyltransferase family 39 protein [Planctomycetota bacterium]